MSSVRRFAGAAVTLGAVAATLLAAPVVAPASAAGGFCSGGGVNVVVDFKELGGGVQKGCDPNGAGRTADQVAPAAGFTLSYVRSQPGFVCQVSGEPTADPCAKTPPSNAYWGLWWSDGTSATWTYSSQGAGSLKVPSGGSIAFSWNGDTGSNPPGAAPAQATAGTPTPTKSPTSAPTASAGGGGTGGAGGTGGSGGTATGGTGSAGTGTAPAPTGPTAAVSTRAAPAAGTSKGGSPASAASDGAGTTKRAHPGRSGRSGRHAAGRTATAAASPGVAPTGPVTSPAAAAETPQTAPAAATVEEGRLPLWAPLGLLGAVLAGTATALVVRRRGRPPL
ncbi:hypothetical protein [Nocardioides mesophilus]|uniref:Uncharacterized protein n=1 Tax=Nocardioides mesophilus TaxID=433659 RepID=A0A7G9R8X0_9ACTN|nr:hypothetical protein [Nocardioides mesophilus]QNN52045.1 hypothetical protein H9L09_16235 [Nocardioides mesophilus]